MYHTVLNFNIKLTFKMFSLKKQITKLFNRSIIQENLYRPDNQ